MVGWCVGPVWIVVFSLVASANNLPGTAAWSGGAFYTNVVVVSEPWSIHVVKVPRTNSLLEIQSRHANGGALGLSTLRDQIADATPQFGKVVAAINGGFYQRDTAYAGAARGLQVASGEVLSAPTGSPCLWLDVGGNPHLEEVTSEFRVTLPDGRTTPFGLNEARADDAVVLYTPAVGSSTHTTNGLELVLERHTSIRWLPLRMGQFYSARVREVRSGGNTPLSPDVMVLSFGPTAVKQFAGLPQNAVLQISTASSPSLSVARNALSGGPVLVRGAKQQKFRAAPDDAYEYSSMLERHPRSAIGWNREWYFLVEVDGRQRDLSVGMTLEELSNCLVRLGCEEALNLDGGGSSTLWFDGEVRNNPCDGYERTIANSVVVVQKPARGAKDELTVGRNAEAEERSPAH
jgi:hypothetical protein